MALSYTLEQLLKSIKAFKASDLHLNVGTEPKLRIDGKLTSLNLPILYKEDNIELLYSILTEKQKAQLEEELELDFSYEIPNVGRFRVNYYYEKEYLSGVFRIIPEKPPTLDEIEAPLIFKELIKKEKGLILVTGPTGSGKSTTLAAMINEINLKYPKHILTIEDPIEFIHKHKKALISQREVNRDTKSFHNALRAALREDPDVILVGEMRDKETISAAITAAETGHLVLGTLHTNSAAQTINRIVNVFPAEEQEQIRTQLSLTLQAIISQVLVPKLGQEGRVLAQEILIVTPAISNLIRENKIEQIYSQMQLGQNVTGMQTLNQKLLELVRNGEIHQNDALRFSYKTSELIKELGIDEEE